MSWLISKIKTYGVRAAISALDNIEKPLGAKINSSIKEFAQLDGYGVAKLTIDEIQFLLYAYFQIQPPEDKVLEKK